MSLSRIHTTFVSQLAEVSRLVAINFGDYPGARPCRPEPAMQEWSCPEPRIGSMLFDNQLKQA
jgi:hypothetical protein